MRDNGRLERRRARQKRKWLNFLRKFSLRAILFFRFVQADLIVVANRAADILFALLASVPLGLARPIYLACFAAIDLFLRHVGLLCLYDTAYG